MGWTSGPGLGLLCPMGGCVEALCLETPLACAGTRKECTETQPAATSTVSTLTKSCESPPPVVPGCPLLAALCWALVTQVWLPLASPDSWPRRLLSQLAAPEPQAAQGHRHARLWAGRALSFHLCAASSRCTQVSLCPHVSLWLWCRETIDFLVSEGHLYSTIDDVHFKVRQVS